MGGGRMMGKVFQCHNTDLERSRRGVMAGIMSDADVILSEKVKLIKHQHHLVVLSHLQLSEVPSQDSFPQCPGAC